MMRNDVNAKFSRNTQERERERERERLSGHIIDIASNERARERERERERESERERERERERDLCSPYTQLDMCWSIWWHDISNKLVSSTQTPDVYMTF